MSELEPILLWTQAFSTLSLVGLIWTIQVLHYPLFAQIGKAEFVEYQHRHMRRITWVVAPLMFAELGAASLLFLLEPSDPLAIAGISLVAVIWMSTAFIQVPCHNRLVDGFDEQAHTRLVRTNWIRTVAWTIRGVLSLAMLSCGSIS